MRGSHLPRGASCDCAGLAVARGLRPGGGRGGLPREPRVPSPGHEKMTIKMHNKTTDSIKMPKDTTDSMKMHKNATDSIKMLKNAERLTFLRIFERSEVVSLKNQRW